MVEMSKDVSELIIVLTFALLVFCCIGIDYIPKNLTSERLNNPFVRLAVLASMALAFSYDHYLAILIGFTYLLTKHQLLINNDMKSCGCNDSPVVKKDVKKLISLKKSVKVQKPPLKDSVFVKDSIFNKKANTEFTNEFQFKDAQSNTVNDESMKTEIRTWNNGYGTQGGLM
tara:strand:+ start:4823 stop:5338 length:516 start_codon:yes stop_codon:yes gene_type:complete